MPWRPSKLRPLPIPPRDKVLSEISEGGALFLTGKAKRLVEIARKEDDGRQRSSHHLGSCAVML
ncbi:hypothetical protein HMPREF1986_02204 [Oribacterium sp. oral taxon 078 str. F0263]|nr:hypothetical protein HMPREF1986_02204 [Oribacterium sp. oral taxon 078 str. F0263]